MQHFETFLTNKGWLKTKTILPEVYSTWYKRFKTKTKCFCNNNTSGILVVVECFDKSKYGNGMSFTVSIRAEPKDGIWIDFRCYSITDEEFEEVLDSQVDKLLKAWEAINTNN